jgi:hypothetical protein
MTRVWCWIFGHGQTSTWYEPWDAHGRKTEREVSVICNRCRAVTSRWMESAR